MTRTPHILEVALTTTWGGLEMMALDFARSFAERGYPVCVCGIPGSPLLERSRAAGLPTAPLTPRWQYLDFWAAGELARVIAAHETDVIHAHVSRDLSTLALAVWRAGRGRIVLTQHMDFHRNKKDLFHRWVYRRVAHVVTITEGMRDNHLTYTPVAEDRVSAIYNGVHVPETTAHSGGVRETFGLSEDAIVIGMVGRLDRTKRQDLLIQAAQKLLIHNKNLQFLIAGAEAPTASGSGYEAELRQLAISLGVADRFRFVGFVEERDALMRAIDVLAHPTPHESFGLVLAEAMAWEKPVVASRAGGALEIVEDGVTGILFEPEDVDGLAAALDTLCSDADRRREMGRAGRRRVETLFAHDRMMDAYESLFRHVAAIPEETPI